jgi:hypothetical protein
MRRNLVIYENQSEPLFCGRNVEAYNIKAGRAYKNNLMLKR